MMTNRATGIGCIIVLLSTNESSMGKCETLTRYPQNGYQAANCIECIFECKTMFKLRIKCLEKDGDEIVCMHAKVFHIYGTSDFVTSVEG